MTTQSHALIVFVDIVQYSTYSDEDQYRLITSLNAEISKELFPLFCRNGSEPNLICLPAGDGLAMVFRNCEAKSIFSLLHCLIEWTRYVTERFSLHKRCEVRVGVHSGTLSIITDINRMSSVCGEGINKCRRIMDASRANQVLFSEEAYKDLMGANRVYPMHPFTAERPAIFSQRTRIVVKHEEPAWVRVMYQEEPNRADDSKSGNSSIYVDCDRQQDVKKQAQWTQSPPASIPRIIDGRHAALERAEFMCDTLTMLIDNPQTSIAICEQATYSTFGITDQNGMRGYSDELKEACLQQKKKFENLLRQKKTNVRILIQSIPKDKSDDPTFNARYGAMRDWMTKNLVGENFKVGEGGETNGSTVQFLESTDEYSNSWQAPPPNMFVVRDHLRIDGYRLRNGVNHGVSLVYYDEIKIEESVNRFNTIFKGKVDTNKTILKKLNAILPHHKKPKR